LQQRRGVIRLFLTALLDIAKRSRHHNHRDDQNKKEGILLIKVTHKKYQESAYCVGNNIVICYAKPLH
jgi:hypothetical protein